MNFHSYAKRGVSNDKKEVEEATQNLEKGLYPGAFCNGFENIFSVNNEDVFMMHADGTGSKSSLAYLYWKETGDLSVFRTLAQDAIVMNTDDLICSGVFDKIYFSNTIGRHKERISKEILQNLLEGMQEFIETLNKKGFTLSLTGGETADIGDMVKTLVLDATSCTQIKKKDFINANHIESNLVILGLASFGKATYEKEENSGIASNGLTLARHELLSKTYREKYPETYDENLPKDLVYCGKYQVSDLTPNSTLTIGKALLSPTRTYLPLFKKVLPLFKKDIFGIIHCTGGGQTKCLKFSKNIHYIKNNLFDFPPLFKLLAKTINHEEMFKTFNCGHRMEIYTTKKVATEIQKIAQEYHIDSKIIGHTEKANKNKLTITHQKEEIVFQ